MRWLVLLLVLAGCSGGNTPPPLVQPPISGWSQFYGSMVNLNSDGSFDFPSVPGDVHYIVQPVTTALIGNTVTLKFTVSGTGTWGISGTDIPPPTVHLFLWERGDNLSGQGDYETYREWAGRTAIINSPQQTVSVKLDPAVWTGVQGQTPSAAAFQKLLNNLYAIGFTFGGAKYAGHGLYSETGKIHFQLDSFTVQ